MEAEIQPAARVSINIPRGLVSLVNQGMEFLKQRGVPAPLAQGLGEVLTTAIQEHPDIPHEEISVTDLAREAGLLRRKGRV